MILRRQRRSLAHWLALLLILLLEPFSFFHVHTFMPQFTAILALLPLVARVMSIAVLCLCENLW